MKKLTENYIQPIYLLHYGRGISYYKTGKYDDSLRTFNESVECGNKNIDIFIFITHFMYKKNLKEIFGILCKNDEIWKNDPVYGYITKNTKNSNDTRRLWFYQYALLYILSLRKEDIDIVNYTSIKTLTALLGMDENSTDEKEINPFRLTSIAEVNDTEEGNVLLKLLGKNVCKIDCNKENINDKYALTALQASFSRKKDSLTMFRLYGKNKEKEATGVCLVFDNSYFNMDDTEFQSIRVLSKNLNPLSCKNGNFASQSVMRSKVDGYAPPMKVAEKNESQMSLEENANKKLPLYYVLYYDEDDNSLVYNPETSKYDNRIIDLNTKENEEEWEKIVEGGDHKIIKFIFSEILSAIDGIIKTDENGCELAYMLLINLHYLIKDVAFIEEAELRMLEIATNYKELKDDPAIKKIYKEYLPIVGDNCYLKKVILGSKVENVHWHKDRLNIFFEGKKHDTTTSVSKLPLR